MMRLTKLRAALISLTLLAFSLVFLLVSSASAATESSYQTQIQEVTKRLDASVREGLDGEGYWQRLSSGSVNRARGLYNRVPLLPKWERPSGEIRREFADAFILLRTIATDTQLASEIRMKLLDSLAQEIGEALEEFTQPYADPVEVKMLDAWQGAPTPVQKGLLWLGTRLAFPFYAGYRDFRESVWPYDDQGMPSAQPHLHAPDALPFFGADYRRNRIAAGALRDAALIFRKALWSPSGNPELESARKALVSHLGGIEPVANAEIQSMAVLAFTVMQWWFALNPQPELSVERNVIGPALSAFVYVGLWQIPKSLRKSNSGYSVFRSYRRLGQAGTWWPQRLVLNRVPALKGLLRYLWFFPPQLCTSQLDRAAKTERLSARKTRLRGN